MENILRVTFLQFIFKECNNRITLHPFRFVSQDTGPSSAVLGPNGVMYLEGRVVSGPVDSLVKLLLPVSTTTVPPKRLADELDEVSSF